MYFYLYALLIFNFRNVIWLSDADQSKGYSIDFHFITVHAISRDPNSFSSPCIYMQLESEEGTGVPIVDPLDIMLTSHSDSEEVREARLVPSTPDAPLEQIYQVMSDCSALNPDPVEGGGDSDDDLLWTGDPVTIPSDPAFCMYSMCDALLMCDVVKVNDAAADARLRHLESVFQMPTPAQVDQLVSNGHNAEVEDEDDDEEEAPMKQ